MLTPEEEVKLGLSCAEDSTSRGTRERMSKRMIAVECCPVCVVFDFLDRDGRG